MAVLNMHAPDESSLNYMKNEGRTDRTERRNRQIHNYNWGLQFPLTTIDTTTRGEISKDIRQLITINQKDLFTFTELSNQQEQNTSIHGTLTNTDHTLGHNTNCSTF